MRKFITTVTYTIILALIFISLSPMATASNEKSLGEYNFNDLKNLTFSCQKNEIKSISLLPINPATCTSSLQIKSVTVNYKTGLKQIYEYPATDAHLSSTFRVIEGTKCLAGVSIAFDGNPLANRCMGKQKFKVSLNL